MSPLALSSACVTGRCVDCSGFVGRRGPEGERVRVPCGDSCHAGTDDLAQAIASTHAARPSPGAVEAGPGAPSGVIDVRHAVTIEEVATVPLRGVEAFALWLAGRTGTRARSRTAVLYLLGPDTAATLVAEVLGMVARAGPDVEATFTAALLARRDDVDVPGAGPLGTLLAPPPPPPRKPGPPPPPPPPATEAPRRPDAPPRPAGGPLVDPIVETGGTTDETRRTHGPRPMPGKGTGRMRAAIMHDVEWGTR